MFSMASQNDQRFVPHAVFDATEPSERTDNTAAVNMALLRELETVKRQCARMEAKYLLLERRVLLLEARAGIK